MKKKKKEKKEEETPDIEALKEQWFSGGRKMEQLQHFNELTPAQAERLALLAEEMGEAIQVIGKILRHGYESHHPNDPTVTNRQLLAKELGDVDCAIEMLADAEDVDSRAIDQASVAKEQKIGRYLHHQGETGSASVSNG